MSHTSPVQTGMLRVIVENEPLKAAYELDSLVFPPRPEQPQALPEPREATGIEQLSRFDRLKAALDADLLLFRATHQYKKKARESGASGVVTDLLVTALGVWAVTRSRMGLDEDASLAIDHTLGWVHGQAGTRIYATAHQRAARLRAEMAGKGLSCSALIRRSEIERLIRTSLSEHSALFNGETGLGSAQLDYGSILLDRGEPQRARDFFRSALGRFAENPDRLFEARALIVSSYLQQGRAEEAAETLKMLSVTDLDDRQRYGWLHLQADLRAAQGRPEAAFRNALMAATSAQDHQLGPERLLDDLIRLGELRDEIPGFSGDARHIIIDLTRRLARAVENDAWPLHLKLLRQRLIEGTPASADCTSAGWLRRQLFLWQQQDLKPAGILFTTDPSTTDPADPEELPEDPVLTPGAMSPGSSESITEELLVF